MRPQLIGSDIARQAMNHLLRAEVMLPPMPLPLRPAALVITGILRRGTLATMPRWMREMAGLSVPRPWSAARRGGDVAAAHGVPGDQPRHAGCS